MRDERHKLIDANRFYEAVLDDAPTALLTVDGDGKVELANKAARRLLVRHQGVRVEDFREYGDAFAKALEGGAVNRPRLVPAAQRRRAADHAGQRRDRPPARRPRPGRRGAADPGRAERDRDRRPVAT